MDHKRKITKEKLINLIAKETNYDVDNVRQFYNALENLLFNSLLSVNKESDIEVKLFEGISLTGKYVPEKIKHNNLNNSNITVKGRIKPKFNITRCYHEKINEKRGVTS